MCVNWVVESYRMNKGFHNEYEKVLDILIDE